mgnify:CR=1 FL=1
MKPLATHIEDRPNNTTRFLVLGRELFPPSGHDKTSLLLAVKDQPAALYQLLTPLAQHGISMTRIESRPARGAKWEYVFFIDVEGHIEGDQLQAALSDLGPVAAQLKVLGAYPAAIV